MRGVRTYWWLNPAAVMVLLHVPLLAVSYAMPEWAYFQLWFEPKYFDLYAAAISALMIFAWLAGFAISKKSGQPAAPVAMTVLDLRNVRSLFNIAYFLTFVGYIAMIVAAVSRGLSTSTLIAALQGEKNVMTQLKDVYFVTVPGLTTLTQFGPATAILGTLLTFHEGFASIRKRAYFLLLVTALRAFFVSERLALIEIIAPAAILAFRYVRFPTEPRAWFRRTVLSGLPVVAVAGLLVIFGGFEYFRSWANFYSDKGGDFASFAMLRAVGYYTTAYNNSAFLLYNFQSDSLIPQFTAEWLWRFPGLNLVFGDGVGLVAERSRNYMSLLKTGVNPEFNNSGGLLMPVVDYGVIGGMIFWFVAGIASRKLYESFRACRFGGLLFYPICLLGLLEASRLIYWTSGRAFPSVVMLLVSLVVLTREPRPVYRYGSLQAAPTAAN